MPIETRRVEGIEGLVSEVLAITKQLEPGRFLWFRGHSCSSYTLIPKIMREGKHIDEVFERERRLMTRFRQRSMAYWPTGYPQNEWEHMFAMQHFGMPTRLLDWSENLFVATYFALDRAVAAVHNHEGQCKPILWCVDPVDWNRSTKALSGYGDSIHVLTTVDDEIIPYQPNTNRKRQKSPLAMFGAHNSVRIVAQRGTFMVWGNEARPLENILDEEQGKLWRIEIDGDRVDLSNALQSLGFSETMVFPELPSLSIELNRMEGWRK